MIDYRSTDLPTLHARVQQPYETDAEALRALQGVVADLLEYLQAPETDAEEAPRKKQKREA